MCAAFFEVIPQSLKWAVETEGRQDFVNISAAETFIQSAGKMNAECTERGVPLLQLDSTTVMA